MKLIIGLGNPGRQYENSRHNIGFMCLNHIARTHAITLDNKQGKARSGTGEICGHKVLLAKPQTYMNSSGDSVRLLVNKFDVVLDDIVVIHDELDLPLGKVRLRQGGSSAGHKGVQSIISSLGSQDFIRLRIGIGRPAATENEEGIIDYVLNDFTREERQAVSTLIPEITKIIPCLLNEGLITAMNLFNKGLISTPEPC